VGEHDFAKNLLIYILIKTGMSQFIAVQSHADSSSTNMKEPTLPAGNVSLVTWLACLLTQDLAVKSSQVFAVSAEFLWLWLQLFVRTVASSQWQGWRYARRAHGRKYRRLCK